MYCSSGTEVEPSGTVTSSLVGAVLRVTNGGTGMDVLPTWEV